VRSAPAPWPCSQPASPRGRRRAEEAAADSTVEDAQGAEGDPIWRIGFGAREEYTDLGGGAWA